jgi:hypothetical protein
MPPRKKPRAEDKTPDTHPPAEVPDVVEGRVVYTQQDLFQHPRRRKALLRTPDGTPGKELAQRVEAAAPLVNEAAKHAQEWAAHDGKATNALRAIAARLAKLRMIYLNSEGLPDMTGTSYEYKDAAGMVYALASFDEDTVKKFQGAVRWYLADEVRHLLLVEDRFAGGDRTKYKEWCAKYGLNPLNNAERQRLRRGTQPALPALKVNAQDPIALLRGSVTHAHRALEIAGEARPESLPDDERESLITELKTIRELAEERLRALADQD